MECLGFELVRTWDAGDVSGSFTYSDTGSTHGIFLFMILHIFVLVSGPRWPQRPGQGQADTGNRELHLGLPGA